MTYPLCYGLRLPDYVWVELEDPDWKLIGCNDWKRYVPSELREQWSKLSTLEKFLIGYMAEQEADKEEWD